MHKEARATHAKWSGRNELQQETRDRFALHSQSVQSLQSGSHPELHRLRTRKQ
ncbi:hypothetical protein [Thermosporothrix hazakensis]|nr:hypothetical protein [Thermosporothrix hazakensis]